MNFYPFHPGDYMLRTAHLDPLEDLAYRRLLDLYYVNEGPVTGDAQDIARIIRMRANAAEVEAVLREFFTETEDGWQHSHCEEVIAQYQAKAKQAAENGKRGGRPRKQTPSQPEPDPSPKETTLDSKNNPAETQPVISANPEITGSKANQEPITNNQNHKDQEPVAAAAATAKAKATRLPAEWALPDDYRAWALTDRPDLTGDVDRIAETFRDYWHAKSGRGATKLDWFATWRNWIRNQKTSGNVHRLTTSRHHGFDQIDYTAGLTARGDGSYAF